MRTPALSRFAVLLLGSLLALGLVACNGQDAEEDPRGALREAVLAFRDYDGAELVFGTLLDDDAQQALLDEGDLTEAELRLLTDSTLTVRGVGGEGDESGETEIVLVLGDEPVASLRALPDQELYVLIDLPAIERTADAFGAGDDIRRGVQDLEQVAGFLGLGDVVRAAQQAEWIRVTGMDQLIEMAEAEQGRTEEPSEEDLEQLVRQVGERLLAFIEDDDVAVTHVDRDDVGERIRMTADGPELRELLGDLLDIVDEVSPAADPTGMGMGPDQLRQELENAIGDDVTVSIDAWVDGGELTQVAVDVFEMARTAGDEDVPDGVFLVTIGISDFGGPVERPDTDAVLDLFDVMGGFMGGLGELGEDPFAEEDVTEDDFAELDEDFCFTEEEIDAFLPPEEREDLSDEELEQLLGVPIC